MRRMPCLFGIFLRWWDMWSISGKPLVCVFFLLLKYLLKSTLHLEAARRSGLSCSGSLCSCVLIVRNNEKRMAGQPAFGTVSNAAFWEIRVGVGRGEAGRGGQDAGTRRETERRMHANAHEHTCTHIPERACLGSYMCQNTLVFINQPITKFYLFFFF